MQALLVVADAGGAGDDGDAAMAVREQRVGGGAAGGAVVDGEAVRLHALDVAVDDRQVGEVVAQRGEVGVAQRVAAQDDAVALALDQEAHAVQRLLARVLVAAAVGGDHVAVVLAQLGVDRVQQRAVERALEVGHEHADGAGALQRQRARDRARAEPELARGRLHARRRGFGERALAADHARRGAHAHAGQLCDVLDRCHGSRRYQRGRWLERARGQFDAFLRHRVEHDGAIEVHLHAHLVADLVDARGRRDGRQLVALHVQPDDLVRAHRLDQRHLGRGPRVAGRMQRQVLGPHAQDRGTGAGRAGTTSPSMKFMLGEPRKPATNMLAGRA